MSPPWSVTTRSCAKAARDSSPRPSSSAAGAAAEGAQARRPPDTAPRGRAVRSCRPVCMPGNCCTRPRPSSPVEGRPENQPPRPRRRPLSTTELRSWPRKSPNATGSAGAEVEFVHVNRAFESAVASIGRSGVIDEPVVARDGGQVEPVVDLRRVVDEFLRDRQTDDAVALMDALLGHRVLVLGQVAGLDDQESLAALDHVAHLL